MKKLFTFLFILVNLYMHSQTSCGNAAPFCAGGSAGITFPASTNNGTAQPGPDYGCLYSTPNPAWYFLQINNPGPLDVLIQGQQANGQPGYDVDFICYGPFSSLAGACNSLTAGNTIDCSYSSSYTETLNIPNAQTGQYYLVLITNFANQVQDIDFSQLNGGATGAGNTNCAILANNPVICAGQSATISAANGSNLLSPTYSLNPGAVTSASGVFTVSPQISTIYTLYISGYSSLTSSVVITQTAVSTVSVNAQPSAAPTVTQTTCTNTLNAIDLHVTFNPPSPVPGYTISWSSLPASILSTSQQTATSIGPNPYTVTVTAAGGCSVVSSFTVNPLPTPATFTFYPYGPTYSVTCAQPTLFINASDPSFSYTWTNGPSAPIMDDQGIFTTGNIGNWTVTATNPATGCMSSHTFVVGQNFAVPSSVISPSFQNITCVSGVITVTATSSPSINITHYFYSAQGGTATTTAPLAIYSPPIGTHTHCIVDNLNGCSSCSTFTVFSSDNFPLLSVASSQNFTLGCSTHSLISIVLSGSTTPLNGGVINYTLLPPSFTNTTYAFASNPGFPNILVPGTYTAAAQDNNNHCVTLVPFSIISNTIGPNIGAIVPNNLLTCYTPSTQLIGTTSNSNVTWGWSYPGPTGVLTVPNSSLTVNTSTNVNNTLVANFTLTITDNINSCSSTSVITIQQNLFPPKANIGLTNFSITCATPSVQLINNSTHGIPATSGFPTNLPVVAQLWQGPTPQTPSSLTASYYGFTPGTYTMTVIDLNNGCTSYTTQYISDNRIFPSIASQTPQVLDCGAAATTLTALVTVTISGAQYTWIAPPTAVIVGPSTLVTLQTKTPGEFRFIVTNPINGCASSGGVDVIPGTLNSGFTVDHKSGYAPLTVNFSNNSNSSLGTSSIVTVWTFGNGTQTTTPATNISPSATYNQPGNYVVTIFATKGSCIASASDTIFVDIPSKLQIPNVFSPNGDNVNDIFFLDAANLTDINARIYDRWGHLVYELVSATGNIAWDGKTETGKEAAAGTYFYIIKATGKDGQTFDTKGTLTLFR